VLLMVIVGSLAGYAGSYAHFSRRGMAEARSVGWPGFFYVPMQEVGPNSPGWWQHCRLVDFYAPANSIDRALFGAPHPVTGITWGLRAGDGSD
jgi:hypothetical protein